MFEASRWHSDERFFAPVITHKNGDHIFVGDTVNFQDPAHGPCMFWNSGEVYDRGINLKNTRNTEILSL